MDLQTKNDIGADLKESILLEIKEIDIYPNNQVDKTKLISKFFKKIIYSLLNHNL